MGIASPASALGNFEQHVPVITEAKDNGTYVSVKWERRSDQKGVNVYRNNNYIDSINYGTVWNDYNGERGDEYYVVAYSTNNKLSKKSLRLNATSGGEVSGIKTLNATKQSNTRVRLNWSVHCCRHIPDLPGNKVLAHR